MKLRKITSKYISCPAKGVVGTKVYSVLLVCRILSTIVQTIPLTGQEILSSQFWSFTISAVTAFWLCRVTLTTVQYDWQKPKDWLILTVVPPRFSLRSQRAVKLCIFQVWSVSRVKAAPAQGGGAWLSLYRHPGWPAEEGECLAFTLVSAEQDKLKNHISNINTES